MPARNNVSMKRETAPEPDSIIALLKAAHWEIRCLLREMEQILDLPTAVFELYPRVRIALEIHSEGEHHALYGPLGDFPDLGPLAERCEAAHAEVERALKRLDEKPWRLQQINDPEWKREFREMHRKVLEHIEEEENVLFAELERKLAPSRIDALGQRYKQGLADISSQEAMP